jgi:hypothetical protein
MATDKLQNIIETYTASQNPKFANQNHFAIQRIRDALALITLRGAGAKSTIDALQ